MLVVSHCEMHRPMNLHMHANVPTGNLWRGEIYAVRTHREASDLDN